MGAGLVIALTIFVGDLMLPLGVAWAVPCVAVVLIALWLPNPRWVLYAAAFCTGLAGIGYFVSPEAGGPTWMVRADPLLAIVAIWVTATLSYRTRRTASDKTTQEAEYGAILKALPDLLFRLSHERKFVGFHAGDPSQLFLAPEQFIGRTPADILPPEAARKTEEAFDRLLSSGEIAIYEYQLLLEKGPRDFEARMVMTELDEILVIVRDVTERNEAARAFRRSEEALRESREDLRHLAGRLLAVREEERAEIAREVHDELGQALTALKLDLAWHADHLPPESSEADKRIGTMLEQVDYLLDQVRQISGRLWPAALDHLGLEGALEWQLEDFGHRTGCTTTAEMDAKEAELGRSERTVVFRILQESLTNIARHSGAKRVDVFLKVESDVLTLQIADDGRGIRGDEVRGSGSMGLLGMKERAASHGGEADIAAGENGGTVVTLTLPL